MDQIRRTALAITLLWSSTACAAPDRGSAGAPQLLYVASALDGTIARVDTVSGRAVGPPLPAGPSPWRLVPGPNGSVAALSALRPHAGEVVHVSPSGGGWATRTLAVKPMSRADVLFAGDGGRYVVVSSLAPTATTQRAACHLTALDLGAGVVAREYPLCQAGDLLFSLTVRDGVSASSGSSAPVLYAGLWRSPAPLAAIDDLPNGRSGSHPRPVGSGAIVALRLDSGAISGRARLAGVPEQLVLAAAPDGWGQKLYCVERTPSPEEWNPGQLGGPDRRWRLVVLDPTTLEVERAWPLNEEPHSLVVAPDGDVAYALVRGDRALQSAIIEIDLSTGALRRMTVLPGESVTGLTVTRERVFALHMMGSEVWAVDRRLGRVVQTIRVGRRPSAAVVVSLGAAGRAS